MTGRELQSRLVRRIEAHYDRLAVSYEAAGRAPAEAHELALKDTLKVLAEALEELRRQGLFPFAAGEITEQPKGGDHASAS